MAAATGVTVSASLAPGAAWADGPQLELSTTTLGNVFNTGQTVSVGVRSNASRLTWELSDISGRSQETASASPSQLHGALKLRTTDPGYYTLRVTATMNGGTTRDATTNLAILTKMDPAKAKDADRIGVDTHYGRAGTPWPQASIPLIAKAGFGHARDDARWAQLEPNGDGRFSVPSSIRSYTNSLKREGVKLYLVLGANNKAYPYVGSEDTDTGRRAFAKYAKYAVEQFQNIDPSTGENRTSYELWNEWNFFGKGPTIHTPCAGDREQTRGCRGGTNYYHTLKLVRDTLNRAHLNANMTAGSQAGYDGQWFTNLFNAGRYRLAPHSGGYDNLDAVSIHLYPTSPESFGPYLDDARLRMRLASGTKNVKPIRISELGYGTGGDDTGYRFDEVTAARYTARSIALALEKGVDRYSIYDLVDDGTADTHEDRLGLLRNWNDPRGAYVPKPAYVAVAAMARQLSGRDPQGLTRLGADGYDATFSGDHGQTLHTLWRKSGGDTRVTVSTKDDSITSTDMVGRSRKLRPTNGKVTVRLTESPVYLTGSITSVKALG